MFNQLLSFIGKLFGDLDARDLCCLCQFILALLTARTVNLSKLALHCAYKSKRREASYRRLQRFVTRLAIPQEKLAAFVLSLIPGPYVLALDRTNWAFGKTPINFLVLSVVWRGQGIPLFWKLLPHKGCSAFADRMALIDAFLKLKNASHIQALTMDREFGGQTWLNALDNLGVTFHVRLRNTVRIGLVKGELVCPKMTFSALKIHEVLHLPGRRRISVKKEAIRGFVSVTRSKEDELVTILSNKNQEKSLENYAKRWGIETLFGALKTRGFCLEDTHLKDVDKLSNLLIPLTLAFIWAFRVGLWLNEIHPIKLKKHGKQAISYFRLGLDALTKAKGTLKKRLINVCFRLKSPSIPLNFLKTQGLL